MTKVFSLLFIMLLAKPFWIHGQLSYEHLSSQVIKYPLTNKDTKGAILDRFLNNDHVAILFDFQNSKDQEYLFEKEFIHLFDRLYDELGAHPEKVKTLFFRSVSSAWLERLLAQAKLVDKKYEHDPNKLWPTVEALAEEKKQLIIFYLDQQNTNDIVKAHYNHESNSFLLNHQVTTPGQLLFLTAQQPKTAGQSELRMTPKFVDAYLDIWKKTGQVPNFVFQDNIVAENNIPDIVNSTEKLMGNISFETQGYDAINWTGDFNATTGSTFCFPTYSGEKVSIVPQSPGYSFEPEKLTFEGNNDPNVTLKSLKKNLLDGTIAYFPFDENINDLSSNRLETINHGIKFVEDYNRGKVAFMDGKNHAKFPKLSDFGMVNHSFTVSAWIKLNSVTEQDQIILSSSKLKYSEGFYILVRNTKPFLAFYHNDLEGQTVLEENKWYNIVWRYRKELQQQAIYVNGKLDAVAYQRPPFRGAGALNFGYRMNPQGVEQFFDGSIDDLIFWNRALGDGEIRNVYEGNFEFVEDQSQTRVIWGVASIVSLLLFGFLYLRKRLGGDVMHDNVSSVSLPEMDSTRNAIFMFGGLKVLDRDGTNITNQITPKLKELFVLLFLSTLKDKKGISSEELSNSIWPDLPRESAINNRGVSTAKLRQILSNLDGISLTYNNQFWTLEVDEQVYSDYNIFLDFTRVKDIDLSQLSGILKAGNFLPNVSKEWLDSYKFEVSNKIIDIYTPKLEKQWVKKNYDLLIEYCEIILIFDVVHETAIKYKIAALKNQKKHEQALKVYQGFINLYKQFYNEDFSVSFNDFCP